METKIEHINKVVNHITNEDVKTILASDLQTEKYTLENFYVHHASDKMIGFLADYWRLTVVISQNDNERKELSYFIKAVSKTNESKANMVKDLKLFDKEITYYSMVKNGFDLSGLKAWSAKFIAVLDDAIVFQDLNSMKYRMCNKFDRFDMSHTLQALKTLANFHASSIILEEKRANELNRSYHMCEEYKIFFDVGGYRNGNPWFEQCKRGALEGIRKFSKYGNDKRAMELVDSRWDDIWSSAMSIGSFSSKYRNVIAHRDLWNNNILFRYDNVGKPNNCVLVDFQATCFQPPAGDVMQLLYCNLDPRFREENLIKFLNYYYQELRNILCGKNISIDSIINKDEFLKSAEDCRLWAVVSCACLIQVFWIDDDLVTEIFSESEKFLEILDKDKVTFITQMMQSNPDYKTNVLAIFDEIVERYVV